MDRPQVLALRRLLLPGLVLSRALEESTGPQEARARHGVGDAASLAPSGSPKRPLRRDRIEIQ